MGWAKFLNLVKFVQETAFNLSTRPRCIQAIVKFQHITQINYTHFIIAKHRGRKGKSTCSPGQKRIKTPELNHGFHHRKH